MTAEPRQQLSAYVHGTCVEIAECGVLIRGKPGAGKSDLALRLLDAPGHGLSGESKAATLVADDQVILIKEENRLFASAPAPLRGLLEIRGIGIRQARWRKKVVLALLVELADTRSIVRFPEEPDIREVLLGVELPLIRINPWHASAPACIRAAIDSLQAGMLPIVSTPLT